MSTEQENETLVDKAKSQIEKLKTQEGRTALRDKAADGLASAATTVKDQFNALKTKEGRSAFVMRMRSMTKIQKVVAGVCSMVALLLVLSIASCVFDDDDEKQNEGMSTSVGITHEKKGGGSKSPSGSSRQKSGKSPIEGLMGYKLGETFNGKLDSPANKIIFGEDWFCVDNKAEFHGYSTMIKVLPRTKQICAIRVYSTEMGINLQTELATVEAMLKKKYKDLEFEQVTETVFGWKPKTGTRVLMAGVMQHPLTPCVKIEVHDTALEPLVEKEKNEILMEKANKEADSVGDVL